MTAGADAAPAFARPALKARGVFAAVLGNGFEFFDFTVYATFLGMIGQAFFPSDNVLVSDLASAATFGVGFVARPLGGALIGAYGDRAGRKPAMTLSIGLMAIGSGIIAFTPGYADDWRLGADPPDYRAAFPRIRGRRRGGACDHVFARGRAERSAHALCELAAREPEPLLAFWAARLACCWRWRCRNRALNDWGWRVPFAFGVLIAPVGIFIRRQLVETLEKPPQGRTSGATAILSAVIRSNWRGVLLGLALISGGTITQYFLITMTPYAIRTLHLPASSAMLGAITLGITGCLGALAGGALADRWGLRPVVIAPRIVLMIVLFPVMKFLIANPSATTLVLAIAILSLLHAASVAVVVAMTPLIFPPEIRSTGLALTYALGVAIFGGTATYVVTWLVGVTGDPLASTYYVMAANAVLLLAALAIRTSDYMAAA